MAEQTATDIKTPLRYWVNCGNPEGSVGYCISSGGHVFATLTVTQHSEVKYIQAQCPNCATLLTENAELKAKLEEAEKARNHYNTLYLKEHTREDCEYCQGVEII